MSVGHLDHVLIVYSSMEHDGETGRKLGLRIKEHKKEVDSFTAGTQTRASRARESSVIHKSAITDHMPWKRTMSSTETRQKWSTEKRSNRSDG